MQPFQPILRVSAVAHYLRCRCTLLVPSLLLLSACSASVVIADNATLQPIVKVPPLSRSNTNTTASNLPVSLVTKAPTQYQCASQIPLAKRVGQLMFPLVTQPEFELAGEFASLGMLGGVVLIGSPNSSIHSDIAMFQKRSLFGPSIVAVDEEGGRVQRLSKLTSSMPSARKVAKTLDVDQARQLAAQHATAIGELGFTMNLAPVADLDFSRAIGDRSFGRDAAVVSDFAMATADGIIDAGLVPVLKHFPGHGRGSDSHHSLPIIPAVQILRQDDLLPFIEAAERRDIPIMVGHLVVEGLTHGQPASVSVEAVNGLLRGELGFDGLVMTDAFNMDAITESLTSAEAAVRSLAAGVDLVMLGALIDTPTAVEQVVEAVHSGLIPEASITESFLRAMHTRTIDVCEIAL